MLDVALRVPSVPVIVKAVAVSEPVGYPEMIPVAGSKLSPAGKFGEIEYVTVPLKPLAVIALELIGSFTLTLMF